MTMYAEYDFTVNQDFTTVSKNLENGGRSIDYYITLDMAKELSMVERYEFVENQDFVCVSQKNESQRAVRIC